MNKTYLSKLEIKISIDVELLLIKISYIIILMAYRQAPIVGFGLISLIYGYFKTGSVIGATLSVSVVGDVLSQ